MDHGSVLADSAVAVVDALGFKGIWKRYEPDKLLSLLESLRQTTDEWITFGNEQLHKEVRVTTALFSDTLVLTATRPDSSTATDSDLLRILAKSVLKLTTFALTTEIPIAYRGAMSFGQLVANDRFFIGPAIDEAAEWAEAADAAIVWLCPSAYEAFGTPKPGTHDELYFVPWAVPIKGVGPFVTYALNTMVHARYPNCFQVGEWDEVSVLRQGALARFNDAADIRVAVKKQNTIRFLNAAEEHSRRWYTEYSPRK